MKNQYYIKIPEMHTHLQDFCFYQNSTVSGAAVKEEKVATAFWK